MSPVTQPKNINGHSSIRVYKIFSDQEIEQIVSQGEKEQIVSEGETLKLFFF